jgi:hypothetical protein
MKTSKNINYRSFGAILLISLVLISLVSMIINLIIPNSQFGLNGIGLPAKLVKYTSKAGNFSIIHPSTWPVHETPQGNHGDMEIFAIINPNGRSFPHMILAKKPFPGNNLDEVAKWGEGRAKLLFTNNFIDVSIKNQIINNVPGYLRSYTFGADGGILGERNYICNDWYFIDNSIGYDLSFCSEVKNWHEVNNIFLQMIESFSLS